MKQPRMKATYWNQKDRVRIRLLFTFLTTPLVLLAAAGTAIAI